MNIKIIFLASFLGVIAGMYTLRIIELLVKQNEFLASLFYGVIIIIVLCIMLLKEEK